MKIITGKFETGEQAIFDNNKGAWRVAESVSDLADVETVAQDENAQDVKWSKRVAQGAQVRGEYEVLDIGVTALEN
jgi:hypothetical protein